MEYRSILKYSLFMMSYLIFKEILGHQQCKAQRKDSCSCNIKNVSSYLGFMQ